MINRCKKHETRGREKRPFVVLKGETAMEEFDVIPKKKSKKRVTIAIVMTAIITFGLTNLLHNHILIYLPSASADKAFFNKLAVVNRILKTQYLYDIDDDMSDMAVAAYVEGLNEPYTHYYSEEMFSSYMSDVSDAYVGIGIVVAANNNNQIEVIEVTELSPAANAGICAGDILAAVNGEEFDGAHMDDAVKKIKVGESGTSVDITVIRDGQSTVVSVVRSKIDKRSVSGKMLDDNIGYMHISGFNSAADDSERSTYTEFKEEWAALAESGMQGLVIDLRNNPGGDLEVMCDMADMIVPKGTITSIEYKNGKKQTYSSDAEEINIPIVILINENSASASELFTICLKDYGKATVVGETSYGKGIVQSVYPFLDGSGMSVTVARYYSPNGVCIHGTGVTPDIEVELPEEYKGYSSESIPDGMDTQLLKAIEVLTQ